MDHITHVVAGDRCDIYFPTAQDEIAGFFDFLAQGHALLGFDTESTGLDLYVKGHQLRLVQIGSAHEAWVLRADMFRDAIIYALRQDRQYVAHNAPYDCLVADRHLGISIDDLMPRVLDTRILGHLIDPRIKMEGGTGLRLKDLCAVHVDPAAPDTEADLTAVFNQMGYTKNSGWARIPINHRTYVTYAGLDPILARRLFTPLSTQVVQSGLGELSTFEHHLQYLTTKMQRKGILLDVPYVERLKVELLNEQDHFCDVAAEFGLENVDSPQQVVAKLVAMGEELTERTDNGNLKADRAVLSVLADLDRQWERIGARDPNPVANAVARAKRAGKWAETYAQSFLDLRDEHNRLHAGINSLQARTARMCLPKSEKLLTRRGSLLAHQIRVGDETLDADGNWVPVKAVHRYKAQVVVEYRGVHDGKPGRYALRSTREHRWLQRSPRGRVFLEPIASVRPTVLLAPKAYPAFGTEFIANTAGEVFATLVGLMATDGRLHTSAVPGEGMSALIYQTERKFYAKIATIIPDGWLSYDRVTNKGDHHELSLRIRKIRPYLEQAGLVPAPGTTLKAHPGLVTWVADLPINEAAAFFRATYMADGHVAFGHKKISCGYPVLARAIRLAAYRLGWLGRVTTDLPSEWSTQPRVSLAFRTATLYLRDRIETTTVADVWCVETETGTFTADGELGFYLTGNSIAKPPLQQLPSSKGEWKIRRSFIPDPGYTMIAADFQAVEMRVLAAVAEEYTMQQAIASGLDLHSFTAERVFGPDFTDVHRKIAKAVGFGKVYGGGAATISRQTGAEIEAVKVALAAYDRTFPGIRRYSYKLVDRMKHGLLQVVTPIGRRLPVDEDRLYAATNYVVQSTARDLFAKAIVRIFDAGLGDYLLLPIHDELLGQAPVAEAQDVVTEIGRLMESTFMGVRITSDPKVVGSSWGAAYGAPENVPMEPLERVGRAKKPGSWEQEELDVFSLV